MVFQETFNLEKFKKKQQTVKYQKIKRELFLGEKKTEYSWIVLKIDPKMPKNANHSTIEYFFT